MLRPDLSWHPSFRKPEPPFLTLVEAASGVTVVGLSFQNVSQGVDQSQPCAKFVDRTGWLVRSNRSREHT